MHNLHEIERYVSEGFVLDWGGNWRPIHEVIEEECNYLNHLENGEIVDNGRWVKIDDLLEAVSPEATSEYKEAERDIRHDHLETKVIKNNLGKTADVEDNALLNEIRGEIEKVLDIDAQKASTAVEDNNERENQKQVSKNISPEKKESAEKETKEIETVENNRKTEAPTEILEEKADSFEAVLPREESKDNGDLDTKSLKIAKAEAGATTQSRSSGKKKAASSGEWDNAQLLKNKLIIIPIAAIIVIAIIIIVVAMLY